MENKTVLCEQCGEPFPLYVNGELNAPCGMNMGWGMMYFCKKCCPPKSVDEIVKDFELFINPVKEMP